MSADVPIAEALERYRRQPSPPEGTANNPFRLVSTLDGPAPAGEAEAAWGDKALPGEAAEFWANCRQARLFVDVEYGQWGLLMLSPPDAATRTAEEHKARPDDLRPDDVVLGEFLGDQELLVLAPSETDARRILIALPLDDRSAWVGAGSDLAEFLNRYFEAMGEKYWER